jgi:hypothetical protein
MRTPPLNQLGQILVTPCLSWDDAAPAKQGVAVAARAPVATVRAHLIRLQVITVLREPAGT